MTAMLEREAAVNTRPTDHAVLWLALGSAALCGLGVGLTGAPPIAGTVGVALLFLVAIFRKPPLAAYTWLLLCPLIVGIARGEGVRIVRPNEALLLLLVVGVTAASVQNFFVLRRPLPRYGPIDMAMVLLVIFGSVIPLLTRYGRGFEVEKDDILYSIVFIKYFILYALFRLAIQTPRQAKRCLGYIVVVGCIVAVIALLQANQLFGVKEFLFHFYESPFEGANKPTHLRATSTIASPFGLADSMIICLAIAIAWLIVLKKPMFPLLAASTLFMGACAAAGSFSGFIGCAVVLATLAVLTNRVMIVAALAVPAAAVATAVSMDAITARLAGFNGYSGLPRSWSGRLENLERFFWPEIMSSYNWVTGVRPAARVPAPETWREWVYIESGHTWLIWTGGIALLLAYLWFTFVVVRDMDRLRRSSDPVPKIVALSTIGATVMIFVLMLFDPHLTVRGTADLYFPLLAMAATFSVASRQPEEPLRKVPARHVAPPARQR